MLSISIASYCSIKRLAFENLSTLKFEPLINLIGITGLYCGSFCCSLLGESVSLHRNGSKTISN
ncbi:MAG TPA: hypothetical protein DEO86_02845 [Colwellia sp.]|nr:hypothetical protein [Colwellia sp.]